MSAGTIDVGWLPGGTYALYSDDVDVILTATRNGLSNDSENPADWNGDANATQKNGPQVTYYRSLIYATPSEYGKQLAEKVNNGETLTWDDLNKATWAVRKTSSSAGYIYPTMWLMKNYDGKKLMLFLLIPATAQHSLTQQQRALISLYAMLMDVTIMRRAGCLLQISRIQQASRVWEEASLSGMSLT